ncbi:MAG: hypothetical protein Q7R76_04775 [Candidatus Woesearchaeota archaeon]|nr:hypothetical protein [Candidatus Woesearchaeota archaeon]
MASTNGNGNGSIDDHARALNPFAQSTLRIMYGDNEAYERDGCPVPYQLSVLMRDVGGPYAHPRTAQRFGDQVLGPLLGLQAIEKVGTRPPLYALTEKGRRLTERLDATSKSP